MENFTDIPNVTLPKEMVKITEHILATKTEDFDPACLEDRYRTVLVENLGENGAQRPTKSVASAPSRQNVISLMDALKRSLAVERPRRAVEKTAARRTTATRKTSKSLPAGGARGGENSFGLRKK